MQREWQHRQQRHRPHRREGAAVEVQGTFNPQRFYETLALIISKRENVKVTVKVTQPPDKEKKKQPA